MASFPVATFGVLADTRTRQQRRRRVVRGAALLAIVLSALLAYIAVGGGRARAPIPVPKDSAFALWAGRVRLPPGRASYTFAINAPADHAYLVTFASPAGSAIAMTMDIGPGAGWTVATRHDAGCSTSATRTVCLLHFAAGGNPGGTWKLVVRKASLPAATVHITVTFNRRRGDY